MADRIACKANATISGALGTVCLNGFCETPGNAVKKLPTWVYVVIAIAVLVVVGGLRIGFCCCCNLCCFAGRATKNAAGAGFAVATGAVKGAAGVAGKAAGAVGRAGRASPTEQAHGGSRYPTTGDTSRYPTHAAPQQSQSNSGPAPLPSNYEKPAQYFELVETVPEPPPPQRSPLAARAAEYGNKYDYAAIPL
ncbi:hypothetical protein PhCBS80983_g04412 [Powellomyces hirtus]|uniref:Uncharacterized protein n=1 Tax=Powellomyces hirtus TaxID=109895 RepID=A0A507E0M8_9FUNG|nr:hypothetical protein PhCBS80983_g04412 [Powellomyces hirtus]